VGISLHEYVDTMVRTISTVTEVYDKKNILIVSFIPVLLHQQVGPGLTTATKLLKIVRMSYVEDLNK
jgi:hypothetical protein